MPCDWPSPLSMLLLSAAFGGASACAPRTTCRPSAPRSMPTTRQKLEELAAECQQRAIARGGRRSCGPGCRRAMPQQLDAVRTCPARGQAAKPPPTKRRLANRAGRRCATSRPTRCSTWRAAPSTSTTRALAYELVTEAVRENPDHKAGRRLLGYVSYRDALAHAVRNAAIQRAARCGTTVRLAAQDARRALRGRRAVLSAAGCRPTKKPRCAAT